MEIEIIKNKYKYRYDTCPNCESQLKTKKDTVDYFYSNGYEIAIINCPCCKKDFIIHR